MRQVFTMSFGSMGARRCKNVCRDFPKFTKYVSHNHRYCSKCEKGIPINEVKINRCPCCSCPVRYKSSWTSAKKQRSKKSCS